MEKKKLGLWAPVLVIAAALLMLAISADAVDAARPAGKGHGKPGSAATLTVSPNPAPVGTTEVTVTGSGFKSGEGLLVGIPGVIPGYGVTTDSSGNFSFTYTKSGGEPFSAGSYPFEAWGWKGNSRILRASTTLIVQ